MTPPIASSSSRVGITSATRDRVIAQRLQRSPQLAQAGGGLSLNSALRKA